MADRLPAAMVPSRWLELAELPKTPSLKIDRTAVRSLVERSQSAARDRPAAPGTPLESVIAGLWRSILGVVDVPADRSFVELGGDSFAIVRMLTGVEQQTGARIGIAEAFEAQSLSAFTALVGNTLESMRVQARSAWVRPLVERVVLPRFFFLDPEPRLVSRWALQSGLFGVYTLLPGQGYAADNAVSLARRLIGQIRAWQPSGPYHLAGAGIGAHLALEMARQLDLLGESIALLVLIDPAPRPAASGSPWGRLQSFIDRQAWRKVDRRWRELPPDADALAMDLPRSLPARAGRHHARCMTSPAGGVLPVDVLLVQPATGQGQGLEQQLVADRTVRLELERGADQAADDKRTDTWLEVLAALLRADRTRRR